MLSLFSPLPNSACRMWIRLTQSIVKRWLQYAPAISFTDKISPSWAPTCDHFVSHNPGFIVYFTSLLENNNYCWSYAMNWEALDHTAVSSYVYWRTNIKILDIHCAGQYDIITATVLFPSRVSFCRGYAALC